MELVTLITVLALVQYLFFCFSTGLARKRYGIKAPAVTGHPLFERHYRVQTNTLEQLVVFLPALWVFSTMLERLNWPGNEAAAVLGVIWLIGRMVYARAYVADPATRAKGFLLTLAPTAVMLAGTGVAILVSIAG